MANEIFRKRIISEIKSAVNKAKDIGALQHSGMKGRLREIVIQDLIEPLLPNGIEVATGSIIDSYEKETPQMDVIIYSTTLLPPFMKMREQTIVPVEACIQAIEIKSQLTATEVSDAIGKATAFKDLAIRGHEPFRNGQRVPKVDSIFSLFAFDTDLSERGKKEIERYEERVPSSLKTRVLINDICVVGRGHWARTSTDPIGWSETKATHEFDEVINMLAMAVDSIPYWIDYRGTPKFGPYIRAS